jgi:hypothetical protein
MAEGYWRYSDPRVAQQPPVSGAVAAAAATPPSSASLKRSRPDYAGSSFFSSSYVYVFFMFTIIR